MEASQASELQAHRRLNEVEGSDRSEFRDIRANEVNPNIAPTTTCGLNMAATREVGFSFMYTTVLILVPQSTAIICFQWVY